MSLLTAPPSPAPFGPLLSSTRPKIGRLQLPSVSACFPLCLLQLRSRVTWGALSPGSLPCWPRLARVPSGSPRGRQGSWPGLPTGLLLALHLPFGFLSTLPACPPLFINKPFLKLSCPFGWRGGVCLLPAETLTYTKHFLICI